jgi:signal transduction histidine kinase
MRVLRALTARGIQGRANLVALCVVLALCAQYAVFSYSVEKSGVLIRDLAQDRAATEALDSLSDAVREFGFRLIGTHGGIYAAPSSAQRVGVLASRIVTAWDRTQQTVPVRPEAKILLGAEEAIRKLPDFAERVRGSLAAIGPSPSEVERQRIEQFHDEWLDISVPLRRYKDAIRSYVNAHAKTVTAEIDARESRLAWISHLALLGGLLSVVVTWVLLAVWIARPTARLAAVIGRMASGELDAAVPYTRRVDEVGQIARAIGVFRQNTLDKQQLEREAQLSHERELLSLVAQEQLRHERDEEARRAEEEKRRLEFEEKRSQALSTARDEALAANRTKSEFLANMSHELRTPLNAIIGFSEMMMSELRGPIGNPNYAGYVKDIHMSGRHLLAIINDILDLSKVEAGKLLLTESVVPISRALADCQRLISERAEDAGVALHLAPAEPILLKVDAVKFKQVLLNILSNAVKFTPAGGGVHVGAWTDIAGATIEIRDTGIGMQPHDISLALAPFGQVQSSMAREYEGTGLGLPLAKSLMELHGGTLEIESALGRGTAVRLQLPPERIANPADVIKAPCAASA